MRSAPRILVLGLAALCACSDGSSSSGTTPGADVANLQLAFDGVRHGGDLIAFTVDETVQGPGDFNGDGDSADFVLHAQDLTTGTTTNLGLAVFDFRVESRRIAFLVSEFRQALTDLNGDGDALDNVLHVYDADTGTTINVGLAGLRGFELEGDVMALLVPEVGQGADLNGDGDQADDVLHLHDLASGVTDNLGLAVAGLAHLDDGSVAFAVSEAAQDDTDSNGDGDALDYTLHVYSPGTGTTSLQLAVSTLFLAGIFVEIEFEHGLIAVNVREGDQGNTDLNGDGIRDDNVLHVHEVASGTTTNLQLSTRAPGYQVGEGFVAVWVSEGQNGLTDYNNDGDVLDDVLQVFHASTGLTTNTRLAVFRFSILGELIVCEMPEADQGDTDLNGDGDNFDVALVLYDTVLGLIDNPSVAAERVHRIGPDLLAFEVLELFQGSDLNADGDMLDRVLHLYDLPFSVLTNLQVSGRILDSDERYLVYVAFEETEDLNGDGDVLDPVLHFLDTVRGRTINVGLAGTATDSNGIPLGFENGVLPFAASEFLQGQADLNGDGDAFDDEVLVLVEPPR